MAESVAINDCWNKIGVWGNGECPELERHVHCRNCPVYSAAAAQLLDSAVPPHYLDEWTGILAKEKPVEGLETDSVVIFRVETEWLALSTMVFQEISDRRPVHSLPHRRNGIVLGLVNIRGELLVCVSLREILGMEKTANLIGENSRAIHQRFLVVSREGQRLVFAVDEVHGTRRFNPGDLKDVPATVARATATYTKGILLWENKSVGCLDDQLLFYTLNRSLT